MSRAYIAKETGVEDDDQLDVLSFSSISPLHMTELQNHAIADSVMQKVAHFISNGSPSKLQSVPPDVKA